MSLSSPPLLAENNILPRKIERKAALVSVPTAGVGIRSAPSTGSLQNESAQLDLSGETKPTRLKDPTMAALPLSRPRTILPGTGSSPFHSGIPPISAIQSPPTLPPILLLLPLHTPMRHFSVVQMEQSRAATKRTFYPRMSTFQSIGNSTQRSKNRTTCSQGFNPTEPFMTPSRALWKPPLLQ